MAAARRDAFVATIFADPAQQPLRLTHIAEELAHNRWLSPGVWRIRTRSGQCGVLKYTTSDRSRGGTPHAW